MRSKNSGVVNISFKRENEGIGKKTTVLIEKNYSKNVLKNDLLKLETERQREAWIKIGLIAKKTIF